MGSRSRALSRSSRLSHAPVVSVSFLGPSCQTRSPLSGGVGCARTRARADAAHGPSEDAPAGRAGHAPPAPLSPERPDPGPPDGPRAGELAAVDDQRQLAGGVVGGVR